MTTFGTIPQSPALREASPESLRELLEAMPKGPGDELLARQVAALRAHREKLAAGGAKPAAQKKQTKAASAGPKAASTQSADDLGV